MSLLTTIVDAIAHLVHPDKPREWFANTVLPTDRKPEEIAARLDELAATSDAKNWRTSYVDLLKLCGLRSDFDARAQAYGDMGGEGTYRGSPAQNTWMHVQVMKAIEQRGIKLPT